MRLVDAAESLLIEEQAETRWQWAVRRRSGVPTVSVRIWLRGGARAESRPGLASLVGRMLCEGTPDGDWQQIARRFEERGMGLASQGTLEAHGLSVDALALDWERALEWGLELVTASDFPDDRLAWQKAQALGELESLADQPEVRTAWEFHRQLYHPHPAERPVLGTRDGIALVERDDCLEFHARALRSGGVVTIAGDVDPASVVSRLEALLAQGDAQAPCEPPPPRGLDALAREIPLRDTEQAHLYLGQLTVPLADGDVPALELAAVVLGAGSGLSGRLPRRVREEEGLAYTVHTTTLAGSGLDPGRFVVYVATSPSTVERARIAIVEELERLLAEGPSEEEISDARDFLLGREPFRRETARQWADLLADSLFYRLPMYREDWRRRRLEKLGPADVTAAARRHLDPTRLRATVGLPVDETDPGSQS